MNPLISVVIPHLNQPDALRRCLELLERQSIPRSSFEVVVVDNGSVVLPRTVTDEFGARLEQEATPGPGPARNTGVAVARGSILAFIDADCRAHPGWLTSIRNRLATAKPFTVLGGDVRIDYAAGDRAATMLESYESVFAYRQKEYIDQHGFSGAGNLAVRRADFDVIGPFPGIEVAEDRAWGRRALMLGYHFDYTPEMIVYHPARLLFSELCTKWNRHIAHDFEDWRRAGRSRMAWLQRAAAVAASPARDIVRIALSDRIRGLRARLLATGALIRIRLYRAGQMTHSRVAPRHGQRGAHLEPPGVNTFAPAVRPALSIVIVSYNCGEWIVRCLRSLFELTPAELGWEVIVVDNASRDGSADVIAAAFPDIQLIRLAANVGFGRGCNAGAVLARGEYILLLNPDTQVHHGTIANLLELARSHPEAGIWGGRTVTPEGEPVDGSCWRFPTLWTTFCVTTGLAGAFPRSAWLNSEAYGGRSWADVGPVDVVSGCLLMIRKTLWDRLDGFDPIYFLYSEEVDLCLRAHRLGARPVVSPHVEVVHYGGKSSSIRSDRLVRLLQGKRTYMRRHWHGAKERIGAALLLAWPLSRYLGLSAMNALRGRRQSASNATAWGDVWRRRHDWLPGYQPPK